MLEDLSRSHPTEAWNAADVLKVVETSFSDTDKPRFEAMETSDGYRVRAAPKDGLRDQGWQESWGNSFDKDRRDRGDRDHRHRHPRRDRGDRDYGSSRGKDRHGAFDGIWSRDGEADWLCDIQRSMLKWKDRHGAFDGIW